MAVTISLSITQNSQSIENNTSNVTVKCTAKWTYGSWNATGECTGSITIDGTKYSFSGIKFNASQTTTGSKVIMTKTVNVGHNDDGTKTLSCSASFVTGLSSSGTVKASASKVLTTIARASQPSLVTYPDSTQNIGNFGEEFSIHMNTASQSFTHTVRYEYGSRSGTIATGIVNGTTWAVPLDFMNDIPNAESGSGRIYVDTYSGSTLVGTKYTGFTATVPASVKPSCTMTLDDVAGIDNIYGSPVKGLSRIKVTINPTLAYSSPIASYSISINGVKYNTATATSGVLKDSGDSVVTVSVTDKRGRSGSASYTMNVQDYSSPAVTKLTAARCNEDGTANRRGAYIKVTFSATISSMDGKNTALYYLAFKKTSETEESIISLADLANNYAPTDYTYIFAATTGNSYDVAIEAVDRHNSSDPARKSTKAPTALAIFSWRGFRNSSGTKEDGAGIGKVPEKPNTLQVGWETEFEKDVRMVGSCAFYGSHGLIDTRDTNETPEWYITNHGGSVVWEFKVLTTIQFANPSEIYGTLQTIIPWKDSSGGLPRQIVYEGGIRWTRIATSLTSWGAWVSDLLRAYPVGSIYLSFSHTNPATLFGGTWVRIENAFLWATTSGGTIGQTGGEATHTLTVNEMPSHAHKMVRPKWYAKDGDGTVSDTQSENVYGYTGGTTAKYLTKGTGNIDIQSAGGGAAHNNMPPYIQVSAWRRTA